MTKLEELAIKHAELSEKMVSIKKKISQRLNMCDGGSFEIEDVTPYGSCLNHAYKVTNDINDISRKEFGRIEVTYDEVLFDYGCSQCVAARDLKMDYKKLSIERGHVRASITKIGKRLSEG